MKNSEDYSEEQVIESEENEGYEGLKEFQDFGPFNNPSEPDTWNTLSQKSETTKSENWEPYPNTPHTPHIHNNQGVALHKPITEPITVKGSIADYPTSSPAGKVIHVLQGCPAGVSEDEIARQCGNGKGLSPAMIQQELLNLSKAGLVGRINGNWVLQEVAQ
jgi:hypothetical protein